MTKFILILSMLFLGTNGLAESVVPQVAVVEDALPKLVLVVVVDQLRRDRVVDEMPGALGKFSTEGRVFVDANLDHAISTTCPGHAVILTGLSPGRAGIPSNTYIDVETFTEKYCVDDDNPNYRVLGGLVNRSPMNLKASTFGDWLKSEYPGSRVFSIGGKDRAAIMMGGHHADGVYWYDRNTGKFTTSGFYAKTLPAYIDAFNGSGPLQGGLLKAIPETWEHSAGTYRVDDYEGESDLHGRESGHPLAQGDPVDIVKQIYASPEIDNQSIALAELIFDEEKLGQGDTPDLLIVALSATDTVGHLYGPRSAESEATLRNVDEKLQALLNHFEDTLGAGNILVALSSDHGVAELPEYMTEQGTNSCPQAGRLSFWPLIVGLNWSVYWRYTFPFDRPGELIKLTGSQLALNRNYLEEHDLDFDDVLATLRELLKEYEFIRATWTREEILNETSETARLFRNSLTKDKSGDLLFQLHRDCVLTLGGGTTHGSVYDYDRDVPVMFYGWRVEAGKVTGTAHTIDIGPTLANHMGISMPQNLDGRALSLTESLTEKVVGKIVESDNQQPKPGSPDGASQ